MLFSSTLGCTVIQLTARWYQGWLLCVSSATGCYMKYLTTVGPTLGANFCHAGFVSLYIEIYVMHWLHGIHRH